jgi:hypothetical protein
MKGHPKLRGLVQCLPLSPGMLFRLGESVLPVRGRAAWEWHQAMRESLEDPASPSLKLLADSNTAAFDRICEALESADMLYDACEDDPEILPLATQKRFRTQIARLELKSAKPLKMFRSMRSKRVLILGASNVALAVAEAALESGLGHITICSLDPLPSEATRMEEIRRQYTDEHSGTVVETVSYSACPWTGGGSGDYVICAGTVGQDWQRLETHLAPLLTAPETTVHIACIGYDRVVAGNIEIPAKGGCSRCLEAYCAEGSTVEHKALVEEGELSYSIGIAARMVIQHLWDVATEIPGENISHSIFDFDSTSCALQRRPRPQGLTECSRCRMLPYLSASHEKPFPESGAPQMALRHVCQRAERLYVDDRSGLIAALDEGDLVQYPMHQCAALLNSRFSGRSFGWITEWGDDILVARISAARRALELSCENMLHGKSAPKTDCLEFSANQPEWRNGLVVSALHPNDLKTEAFYRALAQYAQSLDGWKNCGFEMMPAEGAAKLMFEHLHETGVLPHVKVQELLFDEEVYVLRFFYCGDIISAVAGTEWESIWASGLSDIWLQATALEAMNGRMLEKRVRFRAAAPGLEPEALSKHIQAVGYALSRSFVMSFLIDRGRFAALPLYFAHAFFVDEKDAKD